MAPPRRQQRHGGDGGPAAGDADAIDEGDGDLAAGDGGHAAAAAAGDADAIDEGDGDLAAGDGGSDAADGGDGGPADAIDEGDGDLAAGDGGSVTGAMEIPMLPTEGTAVLPLEKPMLSTTRGTVISPPVTGAMEIPMPPTEGTAVLPLECRCYRRRGGRRSPLKEE